MKFLATTIAALSIAMTTVGVASVDPAADGRADSVATVSTTAKPAPMMLAQRRGKMLAQRRGKCVGDLGYGRTGSYGCG